MSIEIQTCQNEFEYKKWDDYVIRNEKSCFFHQIDYKKVVESSFGHKAYYLYALRDSNVIGVLPLFMIKSLLFNSCLVSLPFVDYGGICADDMYSEKALFEKAIEVAKRGKAQYIELRHEYNNSLNLPTNLSKINVVLNLASQAETVWKSFSPKVRNQVRKAQRSGLEFKGGGSEYLSDFYYVFAKNMRDLGTPVYPKVFFKNLFQFFPHNTEILLVTYKEKPVAGAIAVYFRNTVELPWASALRKYFLYCPNNLLYWRAIERACNKKCKSFRFGRSSKDSGPYRFKKQWEALDQQLYYQYFLINGKEIPSVSPQNPKYQIAINLWKKIPLFITNFIGPHIIKYIP